MKGMKRVRLTVAGSRVLYFDTVLAAPPGSIGGVYHDYTKKVLTHVTRHASNYNTKAFLLSYHLYFYVVTGLTDYRQYSLVWTLRVFGFSGGEKCTRSLSMIAFSGLNDFVRAGRGCGESS